MSFGDFNADELMASLEASSTPYQAYDTPDTSMLNDLGADLDMDLLLLDAENHSVVPPPSRNVEIDRKVVSKRDKLQRVESRTGRPEEIFATIKKKNAKGNKTMQQLGAKLGKGAFGAVFKALDLKTGKFVALKRISLDKVDGEEMMKEINFLKKFEHKNIVKYHGLIKSERHMNLVLEFVDSGSLSQVLAGYGFFPESLAAIYISQVLEGLMYLHTKNVIHRDIKGGNLLITREGYIKLADFGIATVVSTTQRHSLVEGSPYWMAPEVITCSCPPTTSSDIWSIGCTLIELLTGFPPYFDMVAVSAIYKMVNEECPPVPDDLSANCEDFIRKCFIFKPEHRPTAAELRNHPWILEFVPKEEKIVPDLDEVRNKVKQHTLNRESGLLVSKKLSELNETDSMSEEIVAQIESPFPDEEDLVFSEETTDTTRKKKAKKGTLSKFTSRKKKEKFRDSSNVTPTSESSLMVVNIYAVETRRSIFTFTVYKIKVMQDARVWDIERTWSDFKEMHTKLELAFPSEKLPALSPRRFWGVLDSDFVRKRWQELQKYLVELLQSKNVPESEAFLSFLTAKNGNV